MKQKLIKIWDYVLLILLMGFFVVLTLLFFGAALRAIWMGFW